MYDFRKFTVMPINSYSCLYLPEYMDIINSNSHTAFKSKIDMVRTLTYPKPFPTHSKTSEMSLIQTILSFVNPVPVSESSRAIICSPSAAISPEDIMDYTISSETNYGIIRKILLDDILYTKCADADSVIIKKRSLIQNIFNGDNRVLYFIKDYLDLPFDLRNRPYAPLASEKESVNNFKTKYRINDYSILVEVMGWILNPLYSIFSDDTIQTYAKTQDLEYSKCIVINNNEISEGQDYNTLFNLYNDSIQKKIPAMCRDTWVATTFRMMRHISADNPNYRYIYQAIKLTKSNHEPPEHCIHQNKVVRDCKDIILAKLRSKYIKHMMSSVCVSDIRQYCIERIFNLLRF